MGEFERMDAALDRIASALLPRLYIAGPMTGLPEFNYPAFNAAEKQLWKAGFTNIFNPASLPVNPDWGWVDYIRRDIPHLCRCNAIALLPGWEKSKGANLELRIAEELQMQMIFVDMVGLEIVNMAECIKMAIGEE